MNFQKIQCILLFVYICSSCAIDLTAAGVNSAMSSSDLELTPSTSAIHEGFTKSLSLRCAFTPRPGSNFLMVTSLIMSRSPANSTNYLEVATLTAVLGEHPEVKDDLGGQVTGKLTSDGSSVMTFDWLYPSQSVEGRYKCDVSGIDKLGHPITISVTAAITERPMDLEIMLSKVKNLEVNQDHVMAELMAMKVKQNESRTAFAQAIGVFRGHQYLLSRPYAWDVPVADVMCRTLGGYLVEVNDDAEFGFIHDMLDNVTWTGYTLFGATDFTHQQTWTYLHSGLPAFLKWGPGAPRNSANFDCLYSGKNENWLMYDFRCVHEPSVPSVFFCELE